VDQPKPLENSTILLLAEALGDAALVASLRQQMLQGGIGYGDLKKQLFQALWDHFADFRRRREEILHDPGQVDAILAHGASRAREAAATTLTRVRHAVGILP
jgi:tryptophanyl-tRNA synthetase